MIEDDRACTVPAESVLRVKWLAVKGTVRADGGHACMCVSVAQRCALVGEGGLLSLMLLKFIKLYGMTYRLSLS